jgi:hypothetical protein
MCVCKYTHINTYAYLSGGFISVNETRVLEEQPLNATLSDH